MRHVLMIAVGLALMVGNSAFAQTRDDLSKTDKIELIQRIDAGEAAYEAGDFERALREYTRAYEILPDPGFHYRIALANERLGNERAALEQYRLYLEKRPDAERRGQVERTVRLLEKSLEEKESMLVTVRVEPDFAAVKLFDARSGELLVEGPSPLEKKLEPTTVRVVTEAEGFESLSRELKLEPGKDATISLEMRPTSPVPSTRSLFRPIAATSIAGFMTAATVVSLLLYSSATDDLDKIRSTPREFSRADAEDAAADANLYQTLSWAFGAASVAAFTWAIYEWSRDDESAEHAGAAVKLTPGGAAVYVHW